MSENAEQLHPDLGKLKPDMLSKASRLRLCAFLRDNFTCQVGREYRETAKLTLAMAVPRSRNGQRALANVYTVEQKQQKAVAGQESPYSEDDLALLASNTNDWRRQFPSLQDVLAEYVRLIREGHRLARIFYFRAYNEATKEQS